MIYAKVTGIKLSVECTKVFGAHSLAKIIHVAHLINANKACFQNINLFVPCIKIILYENKNYYTT